MNLRAVLVAASVVMALGGCDCGRVGLPDERGEDGGIDDAGLAVVTVDAGRTSVLEAAVIAFNGDVLLLQLDGGSEVVASRADAGAGMFQQPRWDPTGTRLLFTDGERAFAREADGTVHRLHASRLNTGAYDGKTTRAEWSPSGPWVALNGTDFSTDSDALFVVADGGLPELVAITRRWAWEAPGVLLYSSFDSNRSLHVTWRYDVATRDAGEAFEGQLFDTSSTGMAVLQRVAPVADGGQEETLLVRSPGGGVAPLLAAGAPPMSFGRYDGVSLSPFGAEAAVRADAVLPSGATEYRVQRVSLEDAAQTTLSAQPSADAQAPLCLRFVPGGRWLSAVGGTPSPTLRLLARDGGVTVVSSPALGSVGDLGCLDWRLRPE